MEAARSRIPFSSMIASLCHEPIIRTCRYRDLSESRLDNFCICFQPVFQLSQCRVAEYDLDLVFCLGRGVAGTFWRDSASESEEDSIIKISNKTGRIRCVDADEAVRVLRSNRQGCLFWLSHGCHPF